MEDDDFDNKSPVGQLIQRVNKLCKKPQIDEQLSNALDVFQEKVTRQEAYLNNGIFNINFAEAALFLQSCAQLYGKKIDLFWDQILEFHTRLIEYDCRDQQEKGKQLNIDVIQKLEERRNRYKRKKKFKLTLPESNTNVDDFIFEKDTELEEPIAFEPDEDLYKAWRRIECESLEITKVPRAIVKQQRRTYRMKNYYIMKNQDWDIYDSEDGEFNTKYSRIPGWHIIYHLFEYNTLGLLPDKHNTIATLRLCCYLRAQFMRDRKIPFNAPYSQYKEEYLAYKKQFFEEEAKKWQNMPLDTMADLRRQLQYLAQKEREEEGDPPKKTWDIPPFMHKSGCGYEGCTECSEDSKSSIITIADSVDKDFDDGFFKEETAKLDVTASLEKLSTGIVDTKLRQDSGFFDISESETTGMDGSQIVDASKVEDATINDPSIELEKTGESDKTNDKPNDSSLEADKTTDETDKTKEAEANKTINAMVAAENATDASTAGDKAVDVSTLGEEAAIASAESDKTIAADGDKAVDVSTTGDQATVPSAEGDQATVPPAEGDKPTVASAEVDTAIDALTTETEEAMDDDNFDTRSIMSDHDYCQMPVNVLKENNTIKKNVILANDAMVPMSTNTRIVQKVVSPKIPKEKKTSDTLMGPPPPKIRKLSKKSMEKLSKSKITPVKEMKFEKFFSMNYQPQLGEGDIRMVDYESDDEVEPEAVLAPDDDVRSIVSDHNYSQLPEIADIPINDSGFVDETLGTDTATATATAESTEEIGEANEDDGDADREMPPENDEEAPLENRFPEERREVDPEYQAEYERLLAQLRESRRQLGEELTIDPERTITERQRREQERKEAKDRVQQWRNTITPILRDLNENDFDIHEYGSKVMEGMEVEESKPFKKIVDGKTTEEVVRYFIASLQLANTYNIEICGAKKGELSNESFNVKLLKKDRYHEHLAEYHAPSEEDFRKKLIRIRELQSRQNEDDHEEEPLSKRQRTENSNKRKRQSHKSSPTSSTTQIHSTSDTPKRYLAKRQKKTNPSNSVNDKNIVVRLTPIVRHDADVDTSSTSRPPIGISEELTIPQCENPERQSNENSNENNNSSTSSTTQVPFNSDISKIHLAKRSKNTSTYPPNPVKGKNIVVKLTPIVRHDTDVNTPSTSRSPFGVCETSEQFCEELALAQSENPERFSTPQTQRPLRPAEPIGSNVRLSF